ncbi:TfoX/Sxy family protein [Candidatus Uhrbacteria bacterium]|nr:TfoX/Sxy family protein [Candidatus Uhrbacteria bacterium]
MASTIAFRDYVLQDLFLGMEGISSRRMFGGFGLYRHGRIFGIIINNGVYLKLSDPDAAELRRLGGAPFQYKNTRGTVVTMPYLLLPASLLEDRVQCQQWVDRATATGDST